MTPEDLTDEHRAIARAADEFWNKEVVPNLEAIRHAEPGVAARVVRKSAELGLIAVTVPEEYGGMEMDLASSIVVAERLSRDGSYAGWHGAHAGIGTLPVLLFGNGQQKQKYLPKLTSGEWIGSYCLTEPHAGSDALAARTRADLSPDGTHYVLNGQKMWITNAAGASLFTVFAKIGGEKFSALLVERSWPGVSVGEEEKKMGVKGSSTRAVYFDNVKVPVENVLGEIGRGHVIAFNILNVGRLKLGPYAVGGAKDVLSICLKYAKERTAFGHPIGDFGLIQHKLAEMAIRIFAAETMTFRVVGQIEGHLHGWSWNQPEAARHHLEAIEEFAIECSYIKVFSSEMLDYVVDEGVQIHGGYGYHQDYAVERAYRDSRVNRIFEGTNEINRLLATGMLLKRAQRGQLALVDAVKHLAPVTSADDEAARLVGNAKKLVLFALGLGYRRFRDRLEKEQEVVAGITDLAMSTFAAESVWLRVRKLGARAGIAQEMAEVFLRDAMRRSEAIARDIVGVCSAGDEMDADLALLAQFTEFRPMNAVAARRRIAARLLDGGRYIF